MPDMPAEIHAVPNRFGAPDDGGYWSIHERGDRRSTPFVRYDLAEKLAAALRLAHSFCGDVGKTSDDHPMDEICAALDAYDEATK